MKLKNEIGNEKLNEGLKDKIAETSESKKTKIEEKKIIVRGLILAVHRLKKKLRKRRQRKEKGADH